MQFSHGECPFNQALENQLAHGNGLCLTDEGIQASVVGLTLRAEQIATEKASRMAMIRAYMQICSGCSNTTLIRNQYPEVQMALESA
jgi:hypothetical protein